MLTKERLTEAGLDGFEVAHAIQSADERYGREAVICIDGGRQIRCPAYPEECDYARVTTLVDDQVVEIAYWHHHEFKDDAAGVLGALLGAAGGKRPPTTKPQPEQRMSDVYKTTFTVTILHQAGDAEEFARQSYMSLEDMMTAAETGDMLAQAKRDSTSRVPARDLAAEQIALANDATFFRSGSR